MAAGADRPGRYDRRLLCTGEAPADRLRVRTESRLSCCVRSFIGSPVDCHRDSMGDRADAS